MSGRCDPQEGAVFGRGVGIPARFRPSIPGLMKHVTGKVTRSGAGRLSAVRIFGVTREPPSVYPYQMEKEGLLESADGSGTKSRSAKIPRFVYVFAAIIFGVWAMTPIVISCLIPDAADRGTFGDLFGSINALFSGWAFLGVIVAIILQREELELQRGEIRNARIAQQQTAASLAYRNEMEALHAEVDRAWNERGRRREIRRNICLCRTDLSAFNRAS